MFYNLKALTVAALAFVITPALGQALTLACTTGQTTGSCKSLITQFCSTITAQIVGLVISDAKSYPARRLDPALLHDGVGLEVFVFDISDSPLRSEARNTDPVNSNKVAAQDCESALSIVSLVCAEGGSGQLTGGAFQFFGLPNTGVCREECGD
ncbi:hypothetical protein B0H14DRAFT_2629998 [Mycena olivaceomarginata]|nr:hypothetical protein B0H14DRAFT_2629998 [Mycena olivaceomarginata]